MKIVFDGSVCFDRFGACYHYYSQMVPRLSRYGFSVTVTPSPTGALNELHGGGTEIQKNLIPSAKWVPHGKVRRGLSAVKQRVEKWGLGLRLPKENAVFQSFYYGLPPNPDLIWVGMILDLIQEKFSPPSAQNDEIRRRKEIWVRKASRFIALSHQTREDLCEWYGIDPLRVDVVCLGIDTQRFRPSSLEQIDTLRNQTKLHRPFFLQVGGRREHKNFARLLEAYSVFAKNDEVDLVCVGEAWAPDEEAALERAGIADRVHRVHRPSDALLRTLYSATEGLIYPSLYEGFGLPPLEAMACGAPVASSNRGSLREVVGEAALLFDPEETGALVRSMEKLRDPAEAQRLRKSGLERVKLFTWDRVARETAEVYSRVLGQTPRTAPALAELIPQTP